MKVAVVFLAVKNRDKLLKLAKAIGVGIESQGHQIQIIDGITDVNSRLTIFDYIVVGTEAISTFGGKLPAKVGPFLAGAGTVQGKRSFAFVTKSFLGSDKALSRLMNIMEKEGMFLKLSDVIQTEEEAELIGQRLHIK